MSRTAPRAGVTMSAITERVMPKNIIHQVQINFSESAWRTLRALARRKGVSEGETIRDAIALEKFFSDIILSGGHVYQERNGYAYEVILR